MSAEDIETFVRIASKGDTRQIETLFKRPGGRTFLETTILLIVNSSSAVEEEKMTFLKSFGEVLDKIEERIAHQKRGERILKKVFTVDNE